MKQSSNRILTSHVGSLPRPKDLLELYHHRHNAGKDPLPHLLGQWERSTQLRPATAGCDRFDAEGKSMPVLRGSQSATRARMEGLERCEASRGQGGGPRCGNPQDQCAGASGSGCWPDHAICGGRGPGERDRRHGLRYGRAYPSAAGVGQATWQCPPVPRKPAGSFGGEPYRLALQSTKPCELGF